MSANVDMIEQMDADDVFAMQFMQWTVAQFCVRVLQNVTHCLQSDMVVTEPELSMQCFKLIHQVVALLADSVVPSALWDDSSVAAYELVNMRSCDELCENSFTTEFKFHLVGLDGQSLFLVYKCDLKALEWCA